MRVACLCGHSVITSLISRSATVFDLGVNYGGFASEIAPFCRQVIGFEPDPRWSDFSRPNVMVVAKAVAGTRGTFNLTLREAQFSSITYSVKGAPSIPVEAVTLEDALAMSPDCEIALVKMNIEGAELAVLQGTPDLLLKRIVQLTVEFHDFLDPAGLPTIKATIRRLETLGFWAVRFSWNSYGDMLFVNQALAKLSPIQKAVIVVIKYGSGIRRVAKRLVGRTRK